MPSKILVHTIVNEQDFVDHQGLAHLLDAKGT